MSRFTGEYVVIGETPQRIEMDHVARYRFAARFVRARRVLDIACGSGYGAVLLAEAGAQSVVGVDRSPDALAEARLLETNGVSADATFARGDIADFGRTDSVDVVTCFETIEHVSSSQEALANIRRVLVPGGLLIISSPNRPITSPGTSLGEAPANRFHVQEFTPAELRGLLEKAGFSVERSWFGQRGEPRLPQRVASAIRRFLKPHVRSSPDVRKVRAVVRPRYFILMARARA